MFIRKYLFVDFLDIGPIKSNIRKQNNGKVSGDARLNNGLYRTDEEKKEYIEESLKRKLP